MDVEQVGSLCAALTEEPLFHLSLHSKELFHSNLIGWMCEAHPRSASRVFAQWVPSRSGATTLRVQRERAHLDLTVELPGLAPFVVENKVFAPPDDAQLDRYAAGGLAGLVEPTLLLLSLGRPAWETGTYRSSSGPVWQHVMYPDLADAIENAAHDIQGFDGDLLAHYCSLVRTLHALAEVTGHVGDAETIALDDATGRLLRSIRLHDALGKLRARIAIAAAEAHTSPRLDSWTIRWEALFSHGQPLVAAFLDRGDGDWLGWQYQGGQWRVVVITSRHAGDDPAARGRRHAYVGDRYAAWFDFACIPGLTGRPVDTVPRTEARGEYNGYNPDFVYRYRKLPALTRAELLALSHQYLTAAAAWAY